MLDREAATAAEYGRIADMIEHGLDQVIANHPAFALRDSIRLRGERTRQLIVQTQRAVTTGEAAVDEQMARVSEGGSSTRASLRSTLNAAAAAQAQAVGRADVGGGTRSDRAGGRARGGRAAGPGSGGVRGGGCRPSSASSRARTRHPAARPRPAIRADRGFRGCAARAGDPAIPEQPGPRGRAVRAGRAARAPRGRAVRGDAARRHRVATRAMRPAATPRGLNHPDYAAAIARYEELIQQYPAFPQIDGAEYTLGTLYSAGERYADAAAIFEKVSGIESSTMRAEAMFRLGDARFELASAARGEQRQALFGKAAGAYEQAVGVAPVTGDIYFLSLYKLGWSYYNQGTQQNQDGYRQSGRRVRAAGRCVRQAAGGPAGAARAAG